MPTQTAGMGKWVCCTKLPLPKHLSNIINAHSDCTVFTVVCFCSHKLWKQYTKVSWVWFRLIISSHWCCFHNLQLQSWTVKQTTLYSLSERGSSTIVHCVEWYKLVLRTILVYPLRQCCNNTEALRRADTYRGNVDWCKLRRNEVVSDRPTDLGVAWNAGGNHSNTAVELSPCLPHSGRRRPVTAKNQRPFSIAGNRWRHL